MYNCTKCTEENVQFYVKESLFISKSEKKITIFVCDSSMCNHSNNNNKQYKKYPTVYYQLTFIVIAIIER